MTTLLMIKNPKILSKFNIKISTTHSNEYSIIVLGLFRWDGVLFRIDTFNTYKNDTVSKNLFITILDLDYKKSNYISQKLKPFPRGNIPIFFSTDSLSPTAQSKEVIVNIYRERYRFLFWEFFYSLNFNCLILIALSFLYFSVSVYVTLVMFIVLLLIDYDQLSILVDDLNKTSHPYFENKTVLKLKKYLFKSKLKYKDTRHIKHSN